MAHDGDQLAADVLQNLTLAYAIGGMAVLQNLNLVSLDLENPGEHEQDIKMGLVDLLEG